MIADKWSEADDSENSNQIENSSGEKCDGDGADFPEKRKRPRDNEEKGEDRRTRHQSEAVAFACDFINPLV